MTTPDLDISVGDFAFVVRRPPNTSWEIVDLKHEQEHLMAMAISGRAHYQVDSRSFDVTAGDIVYFPRQKAHSAWSDKADPWEFASVAFTLNADDDALRYLETIPNHLQLPNRYDCAALFRELVHEWEIKRVGYLIRCRSIVGELLFTVIRYREEEAQNRSAPHSVAMHRIARYIASNADLTFTVGELAEMARLSTPHFRRVFKRVLGYTPVQYQHRVKINKAKDLLLSGECNVSEAAYQLGFDNVYYFSRLFKQVAHVSPSEFLRR